MNINAMSDLRTFIRSHISSLRFRQDFFFFGGGGGGGINIKHSLINSVSLYFNCYCLFCLFVFVLFSICLLYTFLRGVRVRVGGGGGDGGVQFSELLSHTQVLTRHYSFVTI